MKNGWEGYETFPMALQPADQTVKKTPWTGPVDQTVNKTAGPGDVNSRALNYEAALEGERAKNRQGASEISDSGMLFGAPFALSGVSTPQAPYDYTGMNAEEGRNISRGSLLHEYDLRENAKAYNASIPPDEVGNPIMPPLDLSPGVFEQKSRADKRRIESGPQRMIDMASWLAGPLAPFGIAAATAQGTKDATTAYGRGDYPGMAAAIGQTALATAPGMRALGDLGELRGPAQASKAMQAPVPSDLDSIRGILSGRLHLTPENEVNDIRPADIVPSDASSPPNLPETRPGDSALKMGDTIQLHDKDGVAMLGKPSAITDIQHSKEHGSWVQVEGSNSYYPMTGASKVDGAKAVPYYMASRDEVAAQTRTPEQIWPPYDGASLGAFAPGTKYAKGFAGKVQAAVAEHDSMADQAKMALDRGHIDERGYRQVMAEIGGRLNDVIYPQASGVKPGTIRGAYKDGQYSQPSRPYWKPSNDTSEAKQ